MAFRAWVKVKGYAMAKNTICLWYDKDAEAAARFYAETFPDSTVGAILRAPGDYPSGKKGDVLTVEFKVAGVSCIGLNGGPTFKHSVKQHETLTPRIASPENVTRGCRSAVVRLIDCAGLRDEHGGRG